MFYFTPPAINFIPSGPSGNPEGCCRDGMICYKCGSGNYCCDSPGLNGNDDWSC